MKKAKVITCTGMFYDLDDPNAFIADVAKVLASDGVFIAQLMCLRQMLDMGDVGNLCHEHLEFYSLRSLAELFGRHDLKIIDVEENNVNGGSYRLIAGHLDAKGRGPDYEKKILDLLEDEEPHMNAAFYRDWLINLAYNRKKCTDFIRQMVAAGKSVWVYGASTKGNVILQWYGLDSSLITAAADRSPEKHGKYTVGTNIPIVSEEAFREAKPDFALVLPYAFREEFIAREREWREGGGRFIFPLPEFEVV